MIETLIDNDDWVIRQDTKNNMLFVSYFEDCHFVDDICVALAAPKEKRFIVVYYNPTAQQTQVYQTKAKNIFRAGRNFYREHKHRSFRLSIETITEIY